MMLISNKKSVTCVLATAYADLKVASTCRATSAVVKAGHAFLLATSPILAEPTLSP